jgi:hypothetical protein
MRNPFRRRAETPSEPSGAPDLMSAQPPPKVRAIHLRYADATEPVTACGKWIAPDSLTGELAEVTCGACKRTGLYRKTAAGQ